jgi:hypothetical protein
MRCGWTWLGQVEVAADSGSWMIRSGGRRRSTGSLVSECGYLPKLLPPARLQRKRLKMANV